MRRAAALLTAGVLLALAAGCGGSGKDEACIILANGNKLCGADAKAYCERFVPVGADMESASACAAVGAGVDDADTSRPTPDRNVQAFADACVDYGGDADTCQLAAEEAASAGIKYMSIPIRRCLERGGDPLDCVSE